MEETINSLTINQTQEKFLDSKNYIGIFYNNISKILVSGEMALPLINHFSIRKIDDKILNNFYTIIYKRKKIIDEVLVLKLGIYKYLIITNKLLQLTKLLRKKVRKYPLTTINNASNHYSLFSFHGDLADLLFKRISYPYLYKTIHQNYSYYQLLCPKTEQQITLKYFINLSFIPISLDVKKLFLYNNNVVLDLNTIPKKYRLSVCGNIYNPDNLKSKLKKIKINVYELDSNYLVTTNHKIYNCLRKKTGIIHCSFRLPLKDNPYVLAFILGDKQIGSIIKIGKQETLIRPVIN